jgi:hypothetical protein
VYKFASWYEAKNGGKSDIISNENQPPEKNNIKCSAEMTKCRYSAKKNIKSIGPLYSVE